MADVVISGGDGRRGRAGRGGAAGATVLDAGGCLVAPGLVDLHTHLRQPGAEDAETVETGARAAALGGFTAVVAMPNTDPPVDSAAVALEVLVARATAAMCQVAVAGAITVGRAGERLAPMGELAALGVRLFTDDGAGVQDVVGHAPGPRVRAGLRRHPGPALRGRRAGRAAATCTRGSGRAGSACPGIPAEAEEMMVARDIALVRLTGGRVHFLHLSTAGSVALVAAAKAEGLAVTAEVTPHHLSLTHAELAGYDPVFKVNPPLRTEADVRALRAACARRAPSTPSPPTTPPTPPSARTPPSTRRRRGCSGSRRRSRWCSAPWVRTTVATVTERWARAGPATGPRHVGARRARPPVVAPGTHRRARSGPGRRPGRAHRARRARQHLCDRPDRHVGGGPARLASRSRNTPWAGRVMTGQVRHTVFRGEPVVVDAEAQR